MSQDNQKFNRNKSQGLHSSLEYWLQKRWVRSLLGCIRVKKVCGICVSPDDVAFKLLLPGFQIPEHGDVSSSFSVCAGRRGEGCLPGVGVLDYPILLPSCISQLGFQEQ